MPRLHRAPRTRRRRVVATLAAALATIGIVLLGATLRRWSYSGQIAVPAAVVAAGLLLVGVTGLVWARRTMPAAEQADHAEQRARGQLDGLPPGAVHRGGRIHMSSQRAWTRVLIPVLATVMVLLGGLVALVAGTERDVEMLIGGCVVIALGALLFWVRYRIGGTTLTIGPEGVTRTRPHRTVAWRDLAAAHIDRQQLHLVVRREVLRDETVSIPIGVLEIDPVRLLELLANQRNLGLGLPYGTPLPAPSSRGH